ncbi:acyl-CoA dehydrogenase family protein [Mesorhizobium shangrilense]|uniref:Acyl-CoA dehydrogenase family protein n=1 Tax=Mesorhizobium shangrilense TaxID=460060 RepID=A0ABV2DQ47_9HYPH
MTIHAAVQREQRSDFQGWAEKAEEVVRELKRTAVARDLAGAAPHAEIDLLRLAGLLTIYIPKRFGGGGATPAEVLKIIRILAKGDTSIAQIAIYHLFGTAIGLDGNNKAFIDKRLDGFLNKGWFHAGIAQAAYEPLIEARQVEDGFVLNGAKPFTSGAAVADTLQVWVRFAPGTRIDGTDASRHIGQFIVANPTPGLGFGNDWDSIGQRLTVSGSATLENVAASAGDLVGHWPEDTVQPPYVTLHVPIVHAAFGELYLGTALAALEDARDYINQRGRPWLSSPANKASEDTLIVERFGRLSIALASAEALADAAGAAVQRAFERGKDLTAEERGKAAAIAYQSKVHSTEVALEVTSRIFELTGARSTARSFGFDRYWRNVRTHSLHDPVHYKVLEVGDFALNGRVPPPTYYS